MRAIQPCFEIAECSMNVRCPHSWSLIVIVSRQCRFGVPPPPVRSDTGSLLNILGKELLYGLPIGSGGRGQADATCLLRILSSLVSIVNHFNSSKNQRFRRQIGDGAATLSPDGTADNCFISLDKASQFRTYFVNHRSAQPVKQEPRSLVSASNLTFQLLGAKTRSMRGDKIGRPEPLLNRDAGSVQNSSGRGRGLTPARFAFIAVASGLDPEFVHPALRAPKSLRPPALSQIFKACLLIRKAFAKFPERPWKSWPNHAPKIPETPTGVKWISILFNSLAFHSNP